MVDPLHFRTPDNMPQNSIYRDSTLTFLFSSQEKFTSRGRLPDQGSSFPISQWENMNIHLIPIYRDLFYLLCCISPCSSQLSQVLWESVFGVSGGRRSERRRQEQWGRWYRRTQQDWGATLQTTRTVWGVSVGGPGRGTGPRPGSDMLLPPGAVERSPWTSSLTCPSHLLRDCEKKRATRGGMK